MPAQLLEHRPLKGQRALPLSCFLSRTVPSAVPSSLAPLPRFPSSRNFSPLYPLWPSFLCLLPLTWLIFWRRYIRYALLNASSSNTLFLRQKGRAQHRAGPKRDCLSASCAVVITSRRISSLPQSTRVTGILILIGGLQLDVSFHLGIRHCCCGPEGLQPAAACRPFILRTDETSQRAVIQWRRVALLLSCLSHNLKASWHLT